MKMNYKPIMILILLLSFLTANLTAQFTITCNNDSVPVRLKPENISKPIVRINTGTQMKPIAQSGDFIKVIYKSDTGYIKRTFIKGLSEIIQSDNYYNVLKKHLDFVNKINDLPNETPKVETPKKLNLSDATINGAIEMYGTDYKREIYQSGDYDSITLTWHCALGKYRSITYLFKEGFYKKESEYVSDCI